MYLPNLSQLPHALSGGEFTEAIVSRIEPPKRPTLVNRKSQIENGSMELAIL